MNLVYDIENHRLHDEHTRLRHWLRRKGIQKDMRGSRFAALVCMVCLEGGDVEAIVRGDNND